MPAVNLRSIDVYYEVRGAGPRLLVFNGSGTSVSSSAPMIDRLAQHFTVLVHDQRCLGRTTVTHDVPTMADYAADGAALLDHVGWATTRVFGISFGGMVAQEVVARRPDLVHRLVLCGTSGAFGKPDGDWQQSFVASRMAPLLAGTTMAELAATLVPSMAGPKALPEGLRLAQHCMAQVSPATYRRALEALVGFNRQESLGLIAAPTLLIAGEHDPNAPPKVTQRMAERIPDSRYVEFSGIGHLMNLEAPDDFDQTLIEFLRETPQHRLH